jgi:geranyl-CoA carboxylase beta subunit
MPVIESKVDTHSPQFRQQRADMLAKIAEFRAIEQKGRDEEETKRDRYHRRRQLLPRERVHLLLDRGSPWLELSTLCGYQMHDDKDGAQAGGNMIAGIGYVAGTRCMVIASNSAIKGGTMTAMGVQKTHRLQDIALAQKLPVLSLIESGGANLMYQAEIFIPAGRQPGPAVGGRHSADHRRPRLLHGGWCLHAGPVRLRGDGPQERQGVPGRAAAAQGRDRRDRRR